MSEIKPDIEPAQEPQWSTAMLKCDDGSVAIGGSASGVVLSVRRPPDEQQLPSSVFMNAHDALMVGAALIRIAATTIKKQIEAEAAAKTASEG